MPLDLARWVPAAAPQAEVKTDLSDGLDVEEALALAKSRNPRYRAGQLEIDLARARKVTAETYPYNPELGIEGARALPFGRAEDFVARLSISHTFEIGGQRGYRIGVANADVARSGAVTAAGRLLLRAQVTAQFYEVIFLKQREALAGQNLDLARLLLEAAEARFKAKQIPEIDVNLVRLDHGRAKAEKEEAAREVRIARAKLAALIGEPERVEFDVKGELGAIVVIPDRERLHRVAQENRPETGAARAQALMMKEKVRLAESMAVPDVNLGLFAERESSIFDTSSGTLSDRDNIVGIDLSVALPLFNTRRGERMEAEVEQRRAEIEITAISQEIRRDVELAVARLEAARSVVESYERELNKLAQQNLDDMQKAYKAGEVGTLQILRAQEDLNRVKAAYLDAQFALRLALTEIEAGIGTKLSEVK
jgi:cobalt-zinc-cadmium efflux system outer membrane protein